MSVSSGSPVPRPRVSFAFGRGASPAQTERSPVVSVPHAGLASRDMVFHMKTTLNIDDSVMLRLREEAVRRRTTMSALVEAGLRHVLAGPRQVRERREALPPLPIWRSGGFRVDIADRDALYRLMEGD